ncbi:Spo0E family sporulation regulatory protein-aspartic acid phosphatase [Pontibacillus yanchengensis]|uniref:Spo0E family sporulation regulatory protein-aspartic acid phosphatase n=2 Tax=Pontibacillus yanchengensis TaxID=462910 RepID=A0ACC7VDF3_9BACI|nr:Spo0E family sporulation regulatory protein-aspartic acid phosphatase [Pontibacillus yanchengensis]MYL52219.1 Spo0E family sporulation regulatory protein-aspartic acid phosphatase [Pontibacillus yanchengensis]
MIECYIYIQQVLRGGPAVAKCITTTQQLTERIELLRNRMIKVATVKGFTSDESLAISQELDYLLNMYELKKQDRSKSTTI